MVDIYVYLFISLCIELIITKILIALLIFAFNIYFIFFFFSILYFVRKIIIFKRDDKNHLKINSRLLIFFCKRGIPISIGVLSKIYQNIITTVIINIRIVIKITKERAVEL